MAKQKANYPPTESPQSSHQEALPFAIPSMKEMREKLQRVFFICKNLHSKTNAFHYAARINKYKV